MRVPDSGWEPDSAVGDQGDGDVTLTRGGDRIRVEAGSVQAVVDRSTGALVRYSVTDREFLEAPVRPSFWKVPNDNQRGNDYLERLGAWRTAAENRTVENVRIRRDGGRVAVTVDVGVSVEEADVQVQYVFYGSGVVALDVRYTPGSYGDVPSLPRMGLQFQMPEAFSQTTWYGRGPHETYPDRKTSGRVAIHSRPVEEWTHPYVWPQDNANRTDVWWVRFADDSGRGLQIAAETPMNVAARPYTDSTLAAATHTYDLRRADAITVHLDAGIHGVGGDDSWGERTHPQYTVPGNEPHRLRLWLQPVREGTE
jgi:beta-galactosidase